MILNKTYIFLSFIALLLCNTFHTYSQSKAKKTRILFLLDASSSMSNNWNENKARFEVASTILLQIVDSIYTLNNEVEFAVRAYGTEHNAQEKNCTDTRLEIPFNIQNVSQIKTRLRHIIPRGYSPIAYSLLQASENELSKENLYDYSIILISDGGESCQGDVCGTFQKFLQKKIKVKPYIIGLDKNENLKTYYECFGNYINVSTAAEIKEAIKLIVDAHRPVIDKPKQLNLTTTYSQVEPIKETKPSIDTPKSSTKPKENNTFTIQSLYSKYAQTLVQKNEKINANYVKLSNKNNVRIDFGNLSEPAPIPPVETPKIQKTNFALTQLQLKKYLINKKFVEKINANQHHLQNEKNVRFSLAISEEPKPIERAKTELNRLVFGNYLNAQVKRSKLSSIPKTKISVKKATFALQLAPDRDTFFIRSLNNKKMPLLLTPMQAATVKAKTIKTPSKAKFTLQIQEEPSFKPIALKNIKFPLRYSYAYAIPSKSPYNNIYKKAVFKLNIVEEIIAKKDTPLKRKIEKTKPQEINLDYTIQTQNSTETQLQVYFKGPNGKVYEKYKPEIIMNDPKTHKFVHSFKREVQGTEPKPQKVQEGIYDLVVSGSTNLFANQVQLLPNKINKVYIKVTDGTLEFQYLGNITRPVVEYNAIVNRRFAAGATILQKCSDKLYYDPGTYYVEINTMPAIKYSVDLTFGATYVLTIAEPGSLQISNTNNLGRIQLQSVLGDMFVTFYVMQVDGNLEKQKLTLQPGQYKALVPINPKTPEAGIKEVPFRVKSNEETIVELK
ncbi:MAG: VWA domain-containing protein [Chitinophagaceae bacterium]